MKKNVIIIGAGAAGFFSAINIAEKNPHYAITILEKTSKTLSKVRISGGGRCNVTHACFKPYELVRFYPRGEKELLGPFSIFQPKDTVQWFEKRGVKLKTERDGRMFPSTNKSQTIVNCFESLVAKHGIRILFNQSVSSLHQTAKNTWNVQTNEQEFKADAVIMTAGSSPKVWEMLNKLGHKIIPPVPSLFTFNIKDNRIKELPGISVNHAIVKIQGQKLQEEGPLLITHWGLSGPAILKLSARGARALHEMNYHFSVLVNWTGKESIEEVRTYLHDLKEDKNQQVVTNSPQLDIPKRLWQQFVGAAGIDSSKRWMDLSKKEINRLHAQLCECTFEVRGKSTFKDEFVTAGGVDLKEIDFKRFESKLFKNLYFAGEVLNIDALTGGFNFQNAWTGSWIISESL